jgi:anhydro-N-acetylmuramic acid kinase
MNEIIRRLASMDTIRVAGLMSGTSADGVDVSLVDISEGRIMVAAYGTIRYPGELRRMIMQLFETQAAPLADICHLNFVIGEVFASALLKVAKRNGIKRASIHLIGSHGQTIHHIPGGRRFGRRRIRSTLQIGEPCIIAERTGITTVADFRPRDVAAGGEGAPLVPYADYILFRHRKKNRAILNIGGIANLTFLPAGGGIKDILAFDTGPGNMIIDRLAFRASRGSVSYDRNGKLGASGKIHERLLAELMGHKFLRRRPPKSTGREEFGHAYSDALYRKARRKGIRPRDILATATAFTAKSISRACNRFLPKGLDEVIASGGGVHNRTLMDMLRQELHPACLKLTNEFGIHPDAKEAVSFAILARETIRGLPGNVPSATGAERPVVLGKVVPGRC